MTLRLLSALALLLTFAAPTPAVAQGRCRCNMGCHQYPGQCVSNGGGGCEPGYAPFCGTRAATCPNTGWVTCNGECTCTRVGPGDAGVTPLDASTAADVPAPLDVGPRMDAPASDRPVREDVVVVDRPRTDSASATDTPTAGLDTPPGRDAPAMLSDAPAVLSDAPAVLSDAPAGSDAGTPPQDTPVTQADAPLVSLPDGAPPGDAAVCACDGGPCYLGTCPTTRCRFETELGFICPLSGHTCRVIADEAWCVPACLDVQCPAGATCDPRTGTCGALDCDAQRTCPAGARCVMNRCVPVETGDGGVGDGGATPDTANGGCGCRTAHRGDTPRGALALLALCALAGRRRASRGRRSLTTEPPPRARS
jgi:MYXO-CTERM domain-containing protein